MRLVFVADIIPPELRRIVEFLNGQMTPAQVLAVEVRQFVGQGLRALVPRVVGQTAAAQQAKAAVRSAAKRMWDETSFMAELVAQRGPEDAAVAQEILRWASDTGLRIVWGGGGQEGCFYLMVDHAFGTDWTIVVWSYGRIEIQFQHLAREHAYATRHPFVSEEKRLELRRRLNMVPGVNIPTTAIAKRPSVLLSVLVDANARRQFLAALNWLVSELRSDSSMTPNSQP